MRSSIAAITQRWTGSNRQPPASPASGPILPGSPPPPAPCPRPPARPSPRLRLPRSAMLAQSDRTGWATGAAIGLVLDWVAIRETLDIAARRFGVEPPASTLPDGFETASLVSALAETPAIERAMAFGAQQILAQHRGLW